MRAGRLATHRLVAPKVVQRVGEVEGRSLHVEIHPLAEVLEADGRRGYNAQVGAKGALGDGVSLIP
jgi:hypothetical protein